MGANRPPPPGGSSAVWVVPSLKLLPQKKSMSATDRQTLPSVLITNVEDGTAPPWRCQECVKKDQYVVQRVLEVARGEDGKFYLLLEYLGYRYLEIRLESRLVDRSSELKRAYREHANTRSSLSMLYCAGAILGAMWHGQSLKELGMDLKLVHQDANVPHQPLLAARTRIRARYGIGHPNACRTGAQTCCPVRTEKSPLHPGGGQHAYAARHRQ